MRGLVTVNIKSSKNKVEISNITDIGIKAELRELCREHSVNDKLGFSLFCEILFPDLDNPDSSNVLEKESLKTMQFLKALTKLDGCCQKGDRFRVTIEQYKTKPRTQADKKSVS